MDLSLASQMRQAMRRLAAGVSILSANDSQGAPLAMTVSSVTSVSDSPASLLVCVNRDARIATAIEETEKFAISLLAAEHESLSQVCADPGRIDERFAHELWSRDQDTSLPFLATSPAVVFCQLAQSIAYGTHRIFIGNLSHTYFPSAPQHELLLYLNGGYRQLPLEPEP